MKLDSFFDEMTKIALTRAAKMLMRGSLSSPAESLARSTMRSPDTYAAGLGRGSDAIAKKLGLHVHEGGIGKAFDTAKQGIMDKFRGGAANLTGNQLADIAQPLASGMMGGGMTYNNRIFLDPEMSAIRRIGAKENKGYFGLAREMVGKGTPDNVKQQLYQAVKRHEIDEARAIAGGKSFGARKGATWGASENAMHQDPKVLMRESQNLTFMPEARDIMRGVRKTTGELGPMKAQGLDLGIKTPVSGTADYRHVNRNLEAGAVPSVLQKGIDRGERFRVKADKFLQSSDSAKRKAVVEGTKSALKGAVNKVHGLGNSALKPFKGVKNTLQGK
jgi:hypothetical protein